MDLHLHTVAQLRDMLRTKQVSSVELVTHYLRRIQHLDTKLNSFLHVNEALALKEAARADEAIARGEAQDLLGIPVAQKDVFVTRDMPTTAASKMLQNYHSPFDAAVIEKFQQRGAINLGKTNMDEFAMGSSNETSYYGPCLNPWGENRVPGGSSGGSAACVAARLAPAATGTDTGGSIRQPASFCGITGIKPTYGRVSRYGMIAYASSLDQAGPMTQTAEDAALLLNAMSGHDPRDATSSKLVVPDFTADLDKPMAGMVVGIPEEFFTEDLSSEAMALIEQAKKELVRQGAVLKTVHLPNIGYSVPTYYVIAPCEASTNLSRFDGVRYGHRSEHADSLDDLYRQSRQEGFGDEVKRRILIGTFALSSGYYDDYYQKAQKIRQVIRQDYIKAFKNVDLILSPASPSTAFQIKEKIDDPVSMYLSDVFTITVNLAGLPAISFPIGQIDGLPYGLQLIGDRFSEANLLRMVHQYQLATDWHQHVPAPYSEEVNP